MDIQVEGMTLANVAEGELEKQFQDALAEFVQTVADSALYEANKDDELRGQISLKVNLAFHLPTQQCVVEVCSGYKAPKKKTEVRAAYLRSGAMLVDRFKQGELIPMHRRKEEQAGE